MKLVTTIVVLCLVGCSHLPVAEVQQGNRSTSAASSEKIVNADTEADTQEAGARLGTLASEQALAPTERSTVGVVDVIPFMINRSSEDDSCSMSLSYPQITGLEDDRVESIINQRLKNRFLEPVTDAQTLSRTLDFEACAKAMHAESAKLSASSPAVKKSYSVWGDYVIESHTESILSLRDDGLLSNTFPSAHPIKHRVWITVDLKTGQEYYCSDLFKTDIESAARIEALSIHLNARCSVPFLVTKTGLAIAPYSNHLAFWKVEEIPASSFIDLINPSGPLRIFL